MKPDTAALRILLTLSLVLSAPAVLAQRAQDRASSPPGSAPAYTEVFYKSGTLNILAYLYKPDGEGKFPAVVYNHGSRSDEWRSYYFEHIGRMLNGAGYVVLIPERRGYARSDGPIYSHEVGKDLGYRFIRRMEAEADDVVAAIPYLRSLPYVDGKNVGVMGWSFGGIVTVMAASRTDEFRVAVDQAGGAQTWGASPALRQALVAAVNKTKTPLLLQVAKNDRTTESVTTLAKQLQDRGMPHKLILYEPFTRAGEEFMGGPGHRIFSRGGMNIWRNDVVEFLDQYLKPAPASGAKSSGVRPPANQQTGEGRKPTRTSSSIWCAVAGSAA
ncbi:MAG TPA: alpha/beta fold hydrolase [Burkholderiales bacterium]|nr:alpha/beta fold hydrolase [Burkholderiales bacterium]